MKDTPAPIEASVASEEVMSDICRQLAKHGACHVRCAHKEDVETFLLDAQNQLGGIIWHDRSQPNGLVPVRFKPEIDEGARLISDTSGKAEAHMDGVFMPSPPGVIALGVVEMSGDAPETYSIDFKEILQRLPDEVILRHARKDAARIVRADRTARFTPLEFSYGRVRVLYRFDDKVELSAEDGGAPLFSEIFEAIESAKRRVHGLSEGSILFLDNARMLHGRDPFNPKHARRLLLRAWYPAENLTLGAPWEGRAASSQARSRRPISHDVERRIAVSGEAIHLQYGSAESAVDEDLVFAIKQAVGYRHAPLAWDEVHGEAGVELIPRPPVVTGETGFGDCLHRDLETLLWKE